MDEGLSGRYSGAPDYAKWAKKALKEMVEQAGGAVFDGDGHDAKGCHRPASAASRLSFRF